MMTAIFTILAVLALTGLDQLFKYWIDLYLRPIGTKLLIPGVLQFNYTENDGAMMGMFGGKTALMIVLALILIVVLFYIIFSKKLRFGVVYCALVGVLAGGLGNIIDRIFRGYVIDYIEVLFVKFYIFNFADCLITVGAFMIVIYEIYDLVRERRKKRAEANG